MAKPIKILHVDQAVAFGGSIISISHAIRNFDPKEVTAILVAEMPMETLINHIPRNTKIYINKHIMNYSHWAKINERLDKVSLLILRKLTIYALSIVKIFSDIIYSIGLFLIAVKEQPDIIHINNGMDVVEANIVAKVLNKKCIVHQRGDSGINFLRSCFYNRTEKFIAVSNHTKQNMVNQGFPEGKITVMFDPISLHNKVREDIKKKYGLEAQSKCFGIFGRIVDWKGQDVFVKAAIDVLGSMPEAVAFIVGDPSDGSNTYFNKIKDIVDSSPVSDRIFFSGYVQNVDDYYHIMDLVVHASIEPEPFGMVITEAMAKGVPVIASNEGGPLDIIDNGVNGILIPPGNPMVLKKAILSMLRNDMKRREMGEEARKKALKHYNPTEYARNLTRIYKDLLNR